MVDKTSDESCQGDCLMLAFMFTDIEGSTRHWERNPLAMRSALARHDSILGKAITAAGGRVFKTVGDAFYASFSEASAAVNAALVIQRELGLDGFHDIGGLKVRMAIHAGEVECRDGDYFGAPLNRVSRMLALARGGEVLVSALAVGLAGTGLPESAGFVDLGMHQLRDVDEAVQLFRLKASGLDETFPSLAPSGAVSNNLPVLPTSFVGRERELAEIAGLLESAPLVSLVGAGGIGKTRISLEVAAASLGSFCDGVWFIDLAPLTEPLLIGETAAAVLGLPGSGSGSIAAGLIEYLRRKKCLLIFDNCEHLVRPVAELAQRILANCPGVRLLCTSREPLGIAGESIYRLPVFSFPGAETALRAEDALQYEAVRLFVERARASLPSFRLDDDNAGAVAAICRRLDGLPLALELAANRLRLLQPHELARRLDDRFGILTGGNRTALLRQQTLRDLIDWSYLLLDERERKFLERVSVFSGSFGLEAASIVCTLPPLSKVDGFGLLASLVDKSLLVALPAVGGQTRFGLLESTRQFAADKLAASGEAPLLLPRLAGWLVDYFRNALASWPYCPSDNWVSDHAPELDNVRTSLTWALGPGREVDCGLELLACAAPLFIGLYLFPELRRWLELAWPLLDDNTPVLVRGRLCYAKLIVSSYGYNQPALAPLAYEAANCFSRAGEAFWEAVCQMRAACLLLTPTNPAAVEPVLQEACQKLRVYGNTVEISWVLQHAASARYWQGDSQTALEYLDEAITKASALGDMRGLRRLRVGLGEVFFGTGRLDEAIALASANWQDAKDNNDLPILCSVSGNLASYCLTAQLASDIRPYLRTALTIALALGREMHAYTGLERVALYLARQGRFSQAARLCGFVWQWAAARNFSREHTEQLGHDALDKLLNTGLAATEMARAMALGQALDLVEAVSYALAELDAPELHEESGKCVKPVMPTSKIGPAS